jgi:hypothetical protein
VDFWVAGKWKNLLFLTIIRNIGHSVAYIQTLHDQKLTPNFRTLVTTPIRMRSVTFILLLISFAAMAQTGPINIHLNSGKIISTHYAYLYSGYNSYLRIHEKKGEKISIDQVDHIEGIDEAGNYRYFLPVVWGNEVWAERGFTSDRIVIYHTDIVTGKMASTHKPRSCLYSKDGGPLRQLKLKYLKKDLADCPASLEYLKKGKKVGIAQTAVYVASYSLIVGGIVGFIAETSDKELEDPESSSAASIPPAVLIGALGSAIPLLMNNAKREKYLDALKAYQ